MKKIVFILFLFISASLFAAEYPPKLLNLLDKFKQNGTNLEITAVNSVLNGKIKLVQEDYILVDDKTKGVILLSVFQIVTIQVDE